MRKPEEEWPAFKESSPNNEERKSSDTKCVQATAKEAFHEFVQDPVDQTEAVGNPIMEHLMKSCSTFRKARKVMAYVLRFISNARTKVKNRDVILLKELSQAELWLFKWSQQTQEQMVPKKREPQRRRSCFGDGTYPQKNMEDGSCTRNISWRRQTCEESKDKNSKCSLRQTYSQIMPNCYQRGIR